MSDLLDTHRDANCSPTCPCRIHPLIPFLECAVTLEIMELRKQGGPIDLDYEFLEQFGWRFASKADQVLYKGKETATLAGGLARALAIMAFVPGGVRFDGVHFEEKGASR
ncbi:MAG: hypothetical protein KY468_11820 [Armatimonadetes bacterium]|nr:hypothetical protein [Armatimonadota bacterium]